MNTLELIEVLKVQFGAESETYHPREEEPQFLDAHNKLEEAKANLQECRSICHAKPISEKGGRDKILNTMNEVINSFTQSKNVDTEKWLNKNYQYANRLAVLHFLNKNGINTNLFFVYFIGDKNPNNYCPESEEKWVKMNSDIHLHLEIDLGSPLMKKVKHLYLPVQVTNNQ